jgi:hypothetical protein
MFGCVYELRLALVWLPELKERYYTTAPIYQLQYSQYKSVCQRNIRRYIVIPTDTISRCNWCRYRVIAINIVIPTDR